MQNCLLEMWKMWSVARQLISCLFSNNKKYCDVLLAIAQQSEARWPESEGQQFDSQKSWSVKPLNGKQTWPTSCRATTTTYVAFIWEEFWTLSHFESSLNWCFWRSKKVVKVVQIGGRRGEVIWTKSKWTATFFCETIPQSRGCYYW